MSPELPKHNEDVHWETTTLILLVEHSESVQGYETIDSVHQTFARHHREFMAVMEGIRLIGLCSRSQVAGLLRSRYGLAVYSHRQIKEHLLKKPLCIPAGASLITACDLAFSRTGEDFYADILLVDQQECVLGLIAMQSLVRLQARLLSDKAVLAEQHQLTVEGLTYKWVQQCSSLVKN